MSEVEAPQPEVSPVEAFKAALAQHNEAAATSEPQTPETAPEATPFDPAAFRIPDTVELPAHASKFKGKSLAEMWDLDRETQQYATRKADEAAQVRRENEELRARLAAAEQVRKMTEAPQQAPDPWQSRGIDPNEAIFTDPRRTFDVSRDMTIDAVKPLVQQAVSEGIASIRAEQEQQRRDAAIIGTFEAAKAAIKAKGYELSDADWANHLAFIAPRVAQEESVQPGSLFNPDRYVQHFAYLKGAPAVAARPSIPTESAPPIAARAANVAPASSQPTISREAKQIHEQIGGAMLKSGQWTQDEYNNYIAKAGR